MLKSLLKKAEPLADPLFSLRESSQEAERAVPLADEALAAAMVTAAASPDDKTAARALQDAEAAATAARNRSANLRAALASAERTGATREALDAARAIKADRARRWKDAEAHCAARVRAVKDLEAAAKQMGAAFDVLAESSAAIWTSNIVTDEDGGLLKRNALENEVRITLAKAGFKWAASFWPWPLSDRPNLENLIANANAHILAQRSKD